MLLVPGYMAVEIEMDIPAFVTEKDYIFWLCCLNLIKTFSVFFLTTF